MDEGRPSPRDAVHAHLRALPEPLLRRLAQAWGVQSPSRLPVEEALAQRLTDPLAVSHAVGLSGPAAPALLASLLEAGVPVARDDLAAMAPEGGKALDALEEHGLVAPVLAHGSLSPRVAPTPGLDALLRSCALPAAAPAPQTAGLALAAALRRFELALVVGAAAQVRPRLARTGLLHRADLALVARPLAPARSAARLAQELAWLTEAGAFAVERGRLRARPQALDDLEGLLLRQALDELTSPAFPPQAAALVGTLLESGEALALHDALARARAALLRERAQEQAAPRRPGARRELLETLGALLHLAAVVLLDDSGHPLFASEDMAALAGRRCSVTLDPALSAWLRSGRRPSSAPVPGRGHVQSSFDVVVDASCDPSLVARLGLFARIVRADRAAQFHLDARSVRSGTANGLAVDGMLATLRTLAAHDVPPNVVRAVQDWGAQAEVVPPPDLPQEPVPLAVLVEQARGTLAQAAAEAAAESAS